MSIYKSSSLAMIPTAYKDGKLYSIRPTDGSGDFTFSRGSNLAATRVASSGYIEKGRENLLLQSNAFDTTWVSSSTTETGGQSGYDGTSDAWLLQASSTSSSARIAQSISSSGVQTFSIYAKAGTTDWMRINILQSGTNANNYYDISNGLKGASPSSTLITDKIESVGGGWYRISIVVNMTITEVRVQVATADGDESVTSGDNIYIQDAQLEQGLVATSVIETGATTAQAGILEDMPRLDYSGGASCPALLLEPQRTNELVQSEYISGGDSNTTTTFNYGESPEGFNNSVKVEVNSSGYAQKAQSRGGLTANTTYTFSFWLSSESDSADMRIYDNSNGANIINSTALTIPDSGWERVTQTFTTPAGCTSINVYCLANGGKTAGDVTITWGWQLEAGSYPTSYIPTFGSSVTRSRDEMDTTFSSALTSSGSVSVLFDFGAAPLTGSNSTSNNLEFVFSSGDKIIYNQNSSSKHRIELNVDGGTEFIYKTIDLLRSVAAKICVVVTETTYRIFVNGELTSLVGSFTGTADWTSTDTFASALGEPIGVIPMKQLVYFPTALTDAEAIALTE